MFLLSEDIIDSPAQISLEESNGSKRMYIEGIYAQSGIVNKNGREYPTAILEKAVEVYDESKIKTGRAWGELNHPASPSIDPDRVCHRILSMEKEGKDFIGKSIVVEGSPKGDLLIGMLNSGGTVAVSTRGLGSIVKNNAGINEVQDDFSLRCVDVVLDPSAPSSFVNGIMEGVEFFREDSGILTARKIEEIQQTIHNTKSADLDKTMVSIFRDVMETAFKES
jgi:hypothetical protein